MVSRFLWLLWYELGGFDDDDGDDGDNDDDNVSSVFLETLRQTNEIDFIQ